MPQISRNRHPGHAFRSNSRRLGQQGLHLGQLLRGVDPQHLLRGAAVAHSHPSALGEHQGGDIGEVVLPLGVVPAQLPQAGAQLLGPEEVYPGVQLPNGPLRRGAVPVLHDAGEISCPIPDDAAIARGHLQHPLRSECPESRVHQFPSSWWVCTRLS